MLFSLLFALTHSIIYTQNTPVDVTVDKEFQVFACFIKDLNKKHAIFVNANDDNPCVCTIKFNTITNCNGNAVSAFSFASNLLLDLYCNRVTKITSNNLGSIIDASLPLTYNVNEPDGSQSHSILYLSASECSSNGPCFLFRQDTNYKWFLQLKQSNFTQNENKVDSPACTFEIELFSFDLYQSTFDYNNGVNSILYFVNCYDLGGRRSIVHETNLVNSQVEYTGFINIQGGTVQISEVAFYGNREKKSPQNVGSLPTIWVTGTLYYGSIYAENGIWLFDGNGYTYSIGSPITTSYSSFQLIHFQTRDLCFAVFPYDYPDATPFITPIDTPYTTPLTTPYTTPFNTPFNTPQITTPLSTPFSTPLSTPMITPQSTTNPLIPSEPSEPSESLESSDASESIERSETFELSDSSETSELSEIDSESSSFSSSNNEENADNDKVQPTPESNNNSLLLIIGVCIGVLVAIIILVIIIIVLRRRKNEEESTASSVEMEVDETIHLKSTTSDPMTTVSLFSTSVVDDSDPFANDFEEDVHNVVF